MQKRTSPGMDGPKDGDYQVPGKTACREKE